MGGVAETKPLEEKVLSYKNFKNQTGKFSRSCVVATFLCLGSTLSIAPSALAQTSDIVEGDVSIRYSEAKSPSLWDKLKALFGIVEVDVFGF